MIPISRVRCHAPSIPATPEGRQDDLSLRPDLSETLTNNQGLWA